MDVMRMTVTVEVMAEEFDLAGLHVGLTAVEAHAMLNHLSVARATVSTLRLHWGKIDEERCIGLLERAEEQLLFLGDSLADLVRGIPQETRVFLDGIRKAP